jgi:hypothetical protein
MEKFQDIPLDVIFNTIHNVSVRDADDEFEDIQPLPGNSSYVPVPESQTMKKGETTFKKGTGAATLKPEAQAIKPKEEEIEEEIYEDDLE